MKRFFDKLFLGIILFASCEKNDWKEQELVPQTVARTLTFSAGFEQSVEPFDMRAASANINNLLVLLFDQNNILTEILSNAAGNTVTKVVNYVPNQIYTVVYLANGRYSTANNAQIKVGITKITDLYNIVDSSSGIPGGDLIGYGSQKRILTTDAGVVAATLIPKVVRIRMQLPAAERPANKQYVLSYKSKRMKTLSLDGVTLGYNSGVSTFLETFTWIGDQCIAYMRPLNPTTGNNTLTISIIANSTSGEKLEERTINVIPSVIPQVGKSYLINILTKFPDAAAPTRMDIIRTGTDTFSLEP